MPPVELGCQGIVETTAQADRGPSRPPDFFARDVDSLAAGIRGELAELLAVPEDRLDLTSVKREAGLALEARYTDSATGEEFVVKVGEDWAQFDRLVPGENGS